MYYTDSEATEHNLKLDSVMLFRHKCTDCISTRKKDLKDFFSDASSALNRSSRQEQIERFEKLWDALIATMRSSFDSRGSSCREGQTNFLLQDSISYNSMRSIICVGMCVRRKPITDQVDSGTVSSASSCLAASTPSRTLKLI